MFAHSDFSLVTIGKNEAARLAPSPCCLNFGLPNSQSPVEYSPSPFSLRLNLARTTSDNLLDLNTCAAIARESERCEEPKLLRLWGSKTVRSSPCCCRSNLDNNRFMVKIACLSRCTLGVVSPVSSLDALAHVPSSHPARHAKSRACPAARPMLMTPFCPDSLDVFGQLAKPSVRVEC